MDEAFLRAARAAYVAANAGTLRWILDRPALHGVFLNTKVDSRTLRNYDATDGWRGPSTIFGWIQGRGLEALITHARFFEREDAALSARLDAAALPLFDALAALHARDGHAYFAYDDALRPVFPNQSGTLRPQAPAGALWTFSDIFVLKGLFAAAARFRPEQAKLYAAELAKVANAIEAGRFVSDERQTLDAFAEARQGRDYGPRMIMLGAASLLRQLGFYEEARFGRGFIGHVLTHHRIASGPFAGMLADEPGQDASNPGHAVEFAGFGLELIDATAEPALAQALKGVLLSAFALGFAPPGIKLRASLTDGAALTPFYPWWSLPEAVRAAAFALEATGDPASLAVWRQAHEAFFTHYWRDEPAIAYQTLTQDGPVDFVPATPDLDPGYHTGLSFLGAIHAIDRMLNPAS